MNKKAYLRKLVVLSILMAISIILKKFSFSTGEIRISLFDTPLILAGIIAGPIWGMVVGFGSDLLYSFISGYSYSAIMAVSAILWGMVGGLFYNKKVKIVPLLMVVLFTSILTTTINSIQLYIWYQQGMWGGLPLRLINMFVKWPVTTAIVYILCKRVIDPMLRRKTNKKKELHITLKRKNRHIH